MQINYIYNTNDNSLINDLIDYLKNEIDKETIENILIVTPKKLSDDLELYIKKVKLIDPQLKIKFTTINDIVEKIYRKNNDRTTKRITSTQENLLIDSAVKECKEKLQLYSGLCNDEGFISRISATVKNIEDNDMESICNSNKILDDELLKSKLNDINAILKEMNEKIQGKYLNRKQLYDKISNIIIKQGLYINCSTIFAFFDEITLLEMKIVKSIISTSTSSTFVIKNNITSRIPSIDSLQFYKIDSLTSELNKYSRYNNDVVTDIKRLYNKEVSHIEKNLYKYPFSVFKEQTEFLYINNYKTLKEEALNVAYEIKNILNKNEEINYGDFTIVVPNLKLRDFIIREALNEFGLPCDINTDSSNKINIFTNSLILLLELLRTSFDTNVFIDYIHNGTTSLNKQEVHQLEYFLRKNIIKNINIYKETWIDRVDSIEDCEINKLKIAGDKAITPIIKLLNIVNETTTTRDLCLGIFEYLNDMKTNIEQTRKLNNAEVRSWNYLMKSIEIVINNRELITIELNGILENIIKITKQSLDSKVDKKANIISVVDLTNFNKINPEYVFIISLNEGTLPQKSSHDTIFTDEDLKKLKEQDIHIESLLSEQTLKERFNVYDILSKPNKKLYLSYAEIDDEGKNSPPSQVITRLKELFCNINRISTLNETINSLEVNSGALKVPSELGFKFISNQGTEISKLDDYANKETELNMKEKIDLIKNALTISCKDFCESKNKLNNLYFSDTLSVSKIERYVKCPFAYFAEMGLKLKKLEINKPDARHRGIFIHNILEIFGNELRKNCMTWSDVDDRYIIENVKIITKDLIQKNQFKVFTLTAKDREYITTLENVAVISLKAIKEHIDNSFFTPIGYEIDFGEKSYYPSIMLKLPSGKRIKLRGQIDRADKYTLKGYDYIRVIDYKTGETSVNFSDIVHGLQLQLFVYLSALLESYDQNNTLAAGLFYLNLHNPIIKTNPTMPDEEIELFRIKELKMKGIFCNEDNIPQYMDKGIYDQEYTSSINIKAKFKNDGSLSKVTPGLKESEIKQVNEFTKIKTTEIANQIISGDISVKPVKKTNYLHCKFCNYHSVCLFDDTLGINNYNIIQEIKKDDAIEIIKERVSDNNE